MDHQKLSTHEITFTFTNFEMINFLENTGRYRVIVENRSFHHEDDMPDAPETIMKHVYVVYEKTQYDQIKQITSYDMPQIESINTLKEIKVPVEKDYSMKSQVLANVFTQELQLKLLS